MAGAGQNLVGGKLVTTPENNFVIQPIGNMTDDEFMKNVKELLFNPTMQQGEGPFQHTQWAALVKLPGFIEPIVVSHISKIPPNFEDYKNLDALGQIKPRTKEIYHTQMKGGPRANPEMLDQFDNPTTKSPKRRFAAPDF